LRKKKNQKKGAPDPTSGYAHTCLRCPGRVPGSSHNPADQRAKPENKNLEKEKPVALEILPKIFTVKILMHVLRAGIREKCGP
jgi:hypothetical protein